MLRRKVIGAVLVGVIRVVVATGAVAQDAVARPTVAVADVAISPGGWTLPPPQLSSAIIEMMVGELVASQRFHVYDGQWLVPESEAGTLPNLERLRGAATERGVDYIVVGSLTAFSTENKKKRFGGILPTPFFIGGVSRQQAQLRVELAFRIVHVRTGEIVATASGEGLGVRRAVGVAAGGVVGRALPLPVGAFSMARLPSARDAMLDEAVKQAVRSAAASLSRAELPVGGKIPQ